MPPLISIVMAGKKHCHSHCGGFTANLVGNFGKGKALYSHVFLSTTNFNNAQGCFLACASDCRCMSYNFQAQSSKDVSPLCELNSADSATDPTALKARPGYDYHDIIPVGFEQVEVRYGGGSTPAFKCRVTDAFYWNPFDE